MRCAKCNKILSNESAMHCETCGKDYCENCVSTLGFCDCMGEIKYYS